MVGTGVSKMVQLQRVIYVMELILAVVKKLPQRKSTILEPREHLPGWNDLNPQVGIFLVETKHENISFSFAFVWIVLNARIISCGDIYKIDSLKLHACNLLHKTNSLASLPLMEDVSHHYSKIPPEKTPHRPPLWEE